MFIFVCRCQCGDADADMSIPQRMPQFNSFLITFLISGWLCYNITSSVRLVITFSLFVQVRFLSFHSVDMVGHQLKRIKTTVSKDIAPKGIFSTFTTPSNFIDDLLMPCSIWLKNTSKVFFKLYSNISSNCLSGLGSTSFNEYGFRYPFEEI